MLKELIEVMEEWSLCLRMTETLATEDVDGLGDTCAAKGMAAGRGGGGICKRLSGQESAGSTFETSNLPAYTAHLGTVSVGK